MFPLQHFFYQDVPGRIWYQLQENILKGKYGLKTWKHRVKLLVLSWKNEIKLVSDNDFEQHDFTKQI